MALHFDPFAPSLRSDPYPVYRRFRENALLHAGEPPMSSMPGCRYVFGHSEVMAVLRHPDFGRARRGSGNQRDRSTGTALAGFARHMMLFLDPPVHTRLRRLTEQVLQTIPGSEIERSAARIADGLTASFVVAGGGDVIRDFAALVPVGVMAELMALPTTDQALLKRWSEDTMPMMDAHAGRAPLLPAIHAARELNAYFADIIAARTRKPGNDLISRLIASEHDGQRFNPDELRATCALLLIAGHENTVNLIGNGLFALFRHPDQWELLSRDPSYLPAAVEELLRYDSPVQMIFRFAKKPLMLFRQHFSSGDPVAAVLGSANRDPKRFQMPDRLHIPRTDRGHLGFGLGRHSCLGFDIAAVQARHAFRSLLRPEIRLLPELSAAKWRNVITLRGLESLEVRASLVTA